MDARKFFDLVAEMRSAQKEYFALRKQKADQATLKQALQYSMGLEAQVDSEINRVYDILRQRSNENKES